MPHYNFHINLNHTHIHDDDGLELPDIEAAKLEAKLTAREVAVQQLQDGMALDISGAVLIEDVETGAFTMMSFADAIYSHVK